MEGAGEAFGADAVHPITELEERLPSLVRPADRVVYPLGMDRDRDLLVLELVKRARSARARSGEGPTGIEDLAVHLDPLRRVKDAEEIAAMRVAARISAAAHRAGMAAARGGAGE